jgi:2-polyprenyl-3-methyl-5-hydroxy-6-metoxy-1,4-benzoquinol methylase
LFSPLHPISNWHKRQGSVNMSDIDTNYWTILGKQNPYWGVLSQEQYLGKDLPPDRKREFFEEGRRDIEFALQKIETHIQPQFSPKRALDFGCGVGRLMAAIARRAEFVHGIDLSPAMLALARQNLEEQDITNFSVATELRESGFDWINSLLVFQHIKPEIGIDLLRKLLQALAKGGVISLQFSMFRDQLIMSRTTQNAAFARFDGRDFVCYEEAGIREMPIYEYDLSEVLMHITRRGIEDIFMHHINHGGIHSVWIFGRATV